MEIHKVPCVSATDSSSNTDTSVVKVAMLSMKSQNWDIGPQCQGSPVAQNIDLSCVSELHVPGGFPEPTIRGHMSALNTFLPADDGDSVPSTPQDLSRFKRATEHFFAFAIQRLRNLPPFPTHIALALDKIRNEVSNIWSSLSKFAHVERNTLMAAVVVICCTVSLLGWVFSFTFKLFFTLLSASLLLYVLFEREYRYRRLDERLKNLQQYVESLPSNMVASAGIDSRGFSYPIVAKETPANPGRLGRSMQDVVEPVIPGPSKRREPRVEKASPYHIEAHDENTGDTMEQPSQQAAPDSLLKHSDSKTDASAALQSNTGAEAANTTTDVRPWSAFRNDSSSSASTGGEWRQGGGEDGGGESGDDTHEREREWEREWERELGRRASE